MAEQIEVNITSLGDDIQTMEETVSMIRNDMQAMFDAVNELNTMWTGPANSAFVLQFSNDKKSFEALCNTLDEVTASMTDARSEYRKCEGSVADVINGIKI